MNTTRTLSAAVARSNCGVTVQFLHGVWKVYDEYEREQIYRGGDLIEAKRVYIARAHENLAAMQVSK